MTYWYVEQGYVVNGFLVICIITNVLYIENVILNEFFLLWNNPDVFGIHGIQYILVVNMNSNS